MQSLSAGTDNGVVFHLRDIKLSLVDAWKDKFSDHNETVKVSHGDILKGAPAVDAVVSPANSFGFMNGGGIDGDFVKHFGQQLQDRVQRIIQIEYDGEILVGQALIIPTYGPEGKWEAKNQAECNEGKVIKYFISAPTMRTSSMDISATTNAYLAFRAIVLAVREHNKSPRNDLIKSVLVPGLGTNAGKMPVERCAFQMLQAYETFVKSAHPNRIKPESLSDLDDDHKTMCEYKKKTDATAKLQKLKI